MYNNYGFPSSFPTATQPYGFPMQQPQPIPQQQQPQSNIVYVNGIDDVKTALCRRTVITLLWTTTTRYCTVKRLMCKAEWR